MSATISNHLGQRLTGQIKVWMGQRIVELETSDGARHIGRLRTEPTAITPSSTAVSTVDGAP
jgi:hypothetical protein